MTAAGGESDTDWVTPQKPVSLLLWLQVVEAMDTAGIDLQHSDSLPSRPSCTWC